MPDQPEPFVERRKNRRRDEDAVVDHAVQDAPLVHRLLQTGKVAAAVAAISLPLGGVGAALGMRIIGPDARAETSIRTEASIRARADSALEGRIDYNGATIAQLRRAVDSLVSINTDMRSELKLNSYAQCAMMRKLAPELRLPGCDARGGNGGTTP